MHLISGFILAAGLMALPAQAAPHDRQAFGTRVGAFAGGRVLLSFGGPRAMMPRASLTVAPTFLRNGVAGIHHGYGSGLALGFAGRDPHLSAGGMILWSSGATNPAQDRLGLSTLGTVGIAVAGAAVIGGVIFAVKVAEANRNSD